ncbi:MAG: family 10 glycosylhydrolase [Ruminiclostridium sp.]
MFKKVKLRLLIAAILLLAVISFSVPLNVLAAAWDPYLQYIPSYTPVAKSHLRAAWISTVVNLDWPTAKTKAIVADAQRIQKTKEELISLLDKAVATNMNAVFLQVRATSDALYKSELVPWSRYLTGTFGKDPGFDPLQFAITEAHKRNLELHAWFNPYRVSMDTSSTTKTSLNISKSVYKQHPDWIKTANNRFVVDPGIPAARQWVEACVMEVVNNYDIDGVHFDDYFYYEAVTNEMGDDTTYQKYNNGQFSNKADWRRNNTYLLIKELSAKISSAKRWVKFGVSPSSIWRNKKDDPAGSNTNSSYTNYDKCYADTKKWVDEELIDYICPQIYFTYANPAAPYGELVTWWSNTVKGKRVHLYIGQALYRINEGTTTSDKDFSIENGVPEMTRQIKQNITNPDVKGSVMFRINYFFESQIQPVVSKLQKDLWSTKALVPVMSWKGGRAPVVPQNGSIGSVSNGTKLTWNDNDSATTYYAIYRYSNSEAINISSNESARKLVATVRKASNGTQQFIDTSRNDPNGVVYVVTALDRLHNESAALKISYKSKYFNDVGQNVVWAIDHIDKLYENNIISGDGKGNFLPFNNTIRGDFILMLMRTLKLESAFNVNFSDVPQNSYYYNAIGIAKTLGITSGTGQDSFAPKSNISRQEMMVQVYKALKTAGLTLEAADVSELNKYSDAAKISDYAKEAIASLTKNGYVSGSGLKINPKGLTTRAEIAAILAKLV